MDINTVKQILELLKDNGWVAILIWLGIYFLYLFGMTAYKILNKKYLWIDVKDPTGFTEQKIDSNSKENVKNDTESNNQ